MGVELVGVLSKLLGSQKLQFVAFLASAVIQCLTLINILNYPIKVLALT